MSVMFNTTLLRKNLMALTGLFLCMFLVIHLAGNLQLLLPEEEAQMKFNQYSKILSGNYIVKAISYVLFLSIITHTVLALVITQKNKQATKVSYAYDRRKSASKWYSRNMGLLGSLILVFIVSHMRDFWYLYTFGQVPLDSHGYKDLFTIVITTYGELWYVILQCLAFLALGYHLLHGFHSAFKTLGAYPNRLNRILHYTGVGFSLIMTAGFIFIPVFIYLTYHANG